MLWGQNTYVPDDNFEQAIIDLGYDDTLDDFVLTQNITGERLERYGPPRGDLAGSGSERSCGSNGDVFYCVK